MKENKKQFLLSAIGILILVLVIVGITYAFFSYVYTGDKNVVETGTIVFTASDKTLQVTNAFPTTLAETQDVATVSVQGHTTYEDGMNFTIKAIEVTSKNNNVIPTVVVTREEVDGITYTDGKGLTTIYDKTNRLTSDTVLCTGDVAANTIIGSEENPTKLLTLSVYYDKDEYHISDNTKEELIQEGLLPENYQGEIIDTATWNGLSSNVTRAATSAYSFRIQVTAVEGKGDGSTPGGGSTPGDESAALYSTLETSLAANLTEPDVDGTRYVTGETVDNNYVWYSGKMWRIVALNSDGTVKLVTQDAMTSVAWSTSKSNTDYSQSQIRTWLNTEFLPTINESLIVESNWDYTTYASFPTEKDTANAISVSDKVGLLSVYDYMMTGGTATQSTSKTYLNDGYIIWHTLSPTSVSNRYIWNVNVDDYAGVAQDARGSYGARPSVNLKSDITLTGEGNGEIETPYMLVGDIKVGQANELLSTRLSGEYIKFNNVKYRIVGVENGLTKITMADYDVNNNTLSTSVAFGASTDEFTFSTTYGIGKYLDDWYNATSETDTSETYTGLYLSETAKAMIATPSDGVRWYAGPDNASMVYDYTKAIEGTPIEATIGLGRYGEMFSTQFGNVSSSSIYYTWLMTKYGASNVWTVSYGAANTVMYLTRTHGARPSMYLKSDVKITGGSGMPHDAYTISQ